ncbi:putative TetR family transcriptional regulator [Sphingobium sp. SYK-6]|uniref:TetR/AcrR family transcriptional regulator n=1 Tax=Sphingobium sp. (strain NBRC 103272 / SYK-6) TaxID=627192 RepID=UPI0002277164|nr:TetR/AcrR family transcriptional regulator [Sphingobium sp. SYK-6]BAK67535.1 putative TetR family transcriptional regulator [Sphingobium sp. SYK-6]
MTRISKRKRGQGRPADAVGKEAVLSKATELLQDLPPARVTTSLIAREAGVDPALIRYYFGDREKLLLEVVKQLIADAPTEKATLAAPLARLEHTIRHAAHFTRSTKHVHRLMVDELADAKSPEVRKLQGEMNMGAVERLAQMMAQDGGTDLRSVNPLFLHLTLVGLFDFFVSAQPVVRNLVPDDTDMDALGVAFEDFVVDLLLNGLRKRED